MRIQESRNIKSNQEWYIHHEKTNKEKWFFGEKEVGGMKVPMEMDEWHWTLEMISNEDKEYKLKCKVCHKEGTFKDDIHKVYCGKFVYTKCKVLSVAVVKMDKSENDSSENVEEYEELKVELAGDICKCLPITIRRPKRELNAKHNSLNKYF